MIAALLMLMALMLSAEAAQASFMFKGSGFHPFSTEAAQEADDSSAYNFSLTAVNGDRDIVDVADGYLTTMRVQFSASGKHVTNAYQFCDHVIGGCPVAANSTFSMSFTADLGSSVHPMSMAFLTVDYAAGDRFLGTLRLQFTPALTKALEIGVGVAVPVALIICSAIKYMFVVLLDPEPVASWNPLLLQRASGANELASMASIRDIIVYLQFIALALLVNVQYPDYLQSLLARFSWLMGIFSNNWISRLTPTPIEEDGIMIAAGSSQLESMLYFTELPSVGDLWPAACTSLLVGITIVGLCACLSYWKSMYRNFHILSAMLHYWFAVFSMPILWAIFTTFMYMQSYQPDSDVVPFRPYSFGLAPPFYTVDTNGGVIFSMAFVLGLWMCLAVYILVSMAMAKWKGYLSLKNLILWGRFYNASQNDIFYHIYQLVLTVLLACLFSFLSKRGLVQCIIMLITQLTGLITVSGTRPKGLTTVGFVVLLIPRCLQIVVCCLLFIILPDVLQQHPKMMADGVPDYVARAILAIHFSVMTYFFLVITACIGITTWRHFNLRPTAQPENVEYAHEKMLPSHMYYRAPKNQPVDAESKDDSDLIRTDYAVREVDFVYGINGAPNPNFIDKMFKPADYAPMRDSSQNLSNLDGPAFSRPNFGLAPSNEPVPSQQPTRWFRRKSPPKESGFEVIRQ